MRTLFTIIAFVFCVSDSFCQKNKHHRHVPYFRTLKAEKLALHLTKRIKTDSAKVYAIHSWITHNIKYDVKKYSAFDYSRVPVKKILRKRKAICIGYSDLFTELCNHAQLVATSIPGYSKNENVDVNDRLYLDEHIWNAVYVNNEWKLLDACWDSGYVKYYKRTLWGYILHFVTRGKVDKLKYKPHFKTVPSENYFYKSGNYFITDHIPSNPVWQLINPIKTINEIEQDSSYYFKRYDTSKYASNNNYLNGERMMLTSMSEEKRDIADGFSTYKYNHKNQYSIGNSYYLLAINSSKQINTKTTDTITLLKQCDSVYTKLNQALIHYDSNAFFLSTQKKELIANNLKKKDIMVKHNDQFISSTKIAIKNLVLARRLGSSGKLLSRKITAKNESKLRLLVKGQKFYKIKYDEKANQLDSTKAAIAIKKLSDSLNKIDSTILIHMDVIDTLQRFCKERLTQYTKGSSFSNKLGRYLYKVRAYQKDDLDYIVRQLKDTLMKYKFSNDSLLLMKNGEFIVKHLYTSISDLKNDFNIFHKQQKTIIDEYVKLKKNCTVETYLTQQYKNNIDNYRYKLIVYDSIINGYRQTFNEIKIYGKKQKKKTDAELVTFGQERKMEVKMFSKRLNYINKHYNALTRVNRKQINACQKIRSSVQKIENNYKK